MKHQMYSLVPRLPRPPPRLQFWTSWWSDLQSFFEAPEFDQVERKGDEDGGVSNDNCEDSVEMTAVNCLQEFYHQKIKVIEKKKICLHESRVLLHR